MMLNGKIQYGDIAASSKCIDPRFGQYRKPKSFRDRSKDLPHLVDGRSRSQVIRTLILLSAISKPVPRSSIWR